MIIISKIIFLLVIFTTLGIAKNDFKIDLTPKELQWLEKDKTVKFSFDPDWKPIEWADEIQDHKGILSDVIKLIEQKSGITISPIYADSWSEAVKSVKTQQSDAFSAGETENRKKYMNFTQKSLLITPFVFVSRLDENYPNGFNDIQGKKIALLRDSTIHHLIEKNRSDINFILYESDRRELKDLENGTVDIVLLNAITAKYYIDVLGYDDLKIAYKTEFNLDLKFAIRKDFDEEALSIINKSLDVISKKELSDIIDKWMIFRIKHRTDWVLIVEIGATILLIILFILWNNHKLNLMVKEKTLSIEQQRDELQDLTENLELKVAQRMQDVEKAKKEIETIHKHTRDSIEYASLIQGALIPEKGILESYFKDHFVTWTPKDTVGGDIWLFDELRHKDECLLFFIDCTGHGVPGAFVTMIVKAVEREIVSKIKEHPEFDVSPAIIMSHFNKTMKTLLRQETKDSLSNAGWDGGIIYYNRRTQILKFAGAETPLFYTEKDGKFTTVKGNRYSVGYKKCDMNYKYKETVIEVEEGMKFYCTTDGYLDQNGGAKGFPFGKKRFSKIIKENYKEPMADLQTIFQMDMLEYESEIEDNDRNDDMTVIGFEIGEKSEFIEDRIEEIVKYEGVMTQNVIAATMDNLEVKITDMSMLGIISTITIEYCQNMMNYSKDEKIGSKEIVPAGAIEIQYINNDYYDVIATNIVSKEDKEKIEPKLKEIELLDKAGIKKRYRELRRSGQNTHEKGGGIGLYEIAKVSNNIEYSFIPINEDKYQFVMKSFVQSKKRALIDAKVQALK